MKQALLLAAVLSVLCLFGAALAAAQNASRATAKPATAGVQTLPERELIYGAELMTPAERERYRARIRAAGESTDKVRADHRRQLRERARQRGVQLNEPAGTVQRGGNAR